MSAGRVTVSFPATADGPRSPLCFRCDVPMEAGRDARLDQCGDGYYLPALEFNCPKCGATTTLPAESWSMTSPPITGETTTTKEIA